MLPAMRRYRLSRARRMVNAIVRAEPRVSLRRGRRSEQVTATELSAEEAAPVLRAYLERVPVTRPYFDVGVTSPLEAVVAEAHRHPVFALRPPRRVP